MRILLAKQKNAREFAQAQGLASVGIELAVSICLGVWLGKKGDAYFGTTWLVLVGLTIGLLAGFRSVFQVVHTYRQKSRTDES